MSSERKQTGNIIPCGVYESKRVGIFEIFENPDILGGNFDFGHCINCR